MGTNFFTQFSNVAPKTPFTVAGMGAPLIELDKAVTYLKNIVVACDGLVYYDSGTLTWTDDIHIWFNDAAGLAKHNSIAASTQALTDNQFAYVDLNEVDDSVITVTAAAITTGAASNYITFNRLVLGYRNTDDDLYYPVYLNAVNVEYDDIFLPISVTQLGASAPTWATFHGNVKQYTFGLNDVVHGSFELKHDYLEGSDLDLHVHIATNGAEAAVEARYEIEYWIADMNEASTATVVITSADKTLTNADGHHEYIDIGTITGTTYKLGAIICFRLKRVALVGGSDPSADPFVLSVGCHYKKNSLGSRTETAK